MNVTRELVNFLILESSLIIFLSRIRKLGVASVPRLRCARMCDFSSHALFNATSNLKSEIESEVKKFISRIFNERRVFLYYFVTSARYPTSNRMTLLSRDGHSAAH